MSAAQPSTAIRFVAAVERIGERRIVRMPADASAGLPSRGQVAVDATVDGTTVRTVVEPDGRRGHWLDADALGVAQDAATAAVELAPRSSREWPEPTVPDDLAAALGDAALATATWDAVTPMARWEWVRWVDATRNPDTRARRVEVSIDKLAKG